MSATSSAARAKAMPAAVLEPELDWAAGPGRSGGREPFEDPELSAFVAPDASP
jgi:hypothetical protein